MLVMDTVLYYILLLWAKAHAILPMRALYVLSDFLYVVIYRVARYRVKVVRRNLRASFPDNGEDWLRETERKFYHHFADYIVETIKLAHISEEELQRRAFVQNPELVDRLIGKGYSTFVVFMGHYGNWEWYSGSSSRFIDCKIHQIYRPLKNRAVDRLFLYLRTRFNSYCIKKNDTFREIVKLKRDHVRTIVIFLADQTPSRGNLHYWTNFLNQDTPMLTGAERIARKLDLPVLFLDVRKLKRGYYTLEIKLVSESPKSTPENWLTEQYARMMEGSILREPAYWLWTHKRWKYTRADSN